MEMGDERFGTVSFDSESVILLSLCKAARNSGCIEDMLQHQWPQLARPSQAVTSRPSLRPRQLQEP